MSRCRAITGSQDLKQEFIPGSTQCLTSRGRTCASKTPKLFVAMDTLAQTDKQTKIVPGHGPVATRADLEEYRDMLVQVRQRIVDLIAAGKTIDEEVAAAPTREFDAKWGSGYVPPNVFTKMVFSSLTYGGNTGR